VEEVYEQTRVLADFQHITLDLGPVEPMTVHGDYQRLRQLLLNLVDNGLKYTPCGGRVTLALQRRGTGAALHVSDTGMGLSPEEQARVFQRFYRSAAARAQGQRGTGLGLCIAQSIAVAHGGRIEVASTPGSSSIFTVWLPGQA
jgi:signal transduction histidine kinase